MKVKKIDPSTGKFYDVIAENRVKEARNAPTDGGGNIPWSCHVFVLYLLKRISFIRTSFIETYFIYSHVFQYRFIY